MFEAIIPGMAFETDNESGCVATTSPKKGYDGYYWFNAIDSNGVECQYITQMVKGHVDYKPSPDAFPIVAWEE